MAFNLTRTIFNQGKRDRGEHRRREQCRAPELEISG